MCECKQVCGEIRFFLPMKPPTRTHQQQKVRVVKGRPVFYDPPELMAVRQKFLAALSPYRPPAPVKGPVRLVTKWIYPVRKGGENGAWKISRPDTDNMIKLFKDCMTAAGFWEDDAVVCSEITEKFRGDPPGIFVSVTRLEGETSK